MNQKDKKFFKNVDAVSGCEPVYGRNGKIAHWKVTVEANEFPRFRAPDLRGAFMASWVQTINDKKQARHIITYLFRDGLFGRGAERAWQFRINMLGQMAINHNENTK